MTGFRIKRVNLPAELELAVDFKNFVRYSREEEMDLIDLKVEGHVMEEGDLGQLTFENVFFDHCMFTAVSLYNCTFKNVYFEGCTFPSCNFSHSWLNQCKFSNCQMKGADFSESSISNTEFTECNLKYVNFTSSKLNNCEVKEVICPMLFLQPVL